jgi:hypothetical protein
VDEGARTRRLWNEQNRHEGDRQRLFTAVAEAIPVNRVLYPGSFVDIAPSFVFGDVTYVDIDRRAARFFEDAETVDAIIAEHRSDATHWSFIATDYRDDLGLEDDSFDLLVSLYAGPVSDACGHLVRPGGRVLANPSHGDVALLALDERFTLEAVVTSRAGSYAVDPAELESHLIPKRSAQPSRVEILSHGRGIAYTRSPFAYLFQRTG